MICSNQKHIGLTGWLWVFAKWKNTIEEALKVGEKCQRKRKVVKENIEKSDIGKQHKNFFPEIQKQRRASYSIELLIQLLCIIFY